MKKIIRNKLYDTSTAKEIAEFRDLCGGDKAVTEQLYRKRSGEYFLAGEGGSASKYATPSATGGWVGGSAIVPLTYEQARQWAEEHLSADEYAALFGEPENGDAKQNVTYSLSTAAMQRAKREASKRGIGVSEYVESLIMSEH